MKLLRIGVENLNSLYGRHDVDLERQFPGEPLFLITGPTGAMKSRPRRGTRRHRARRRRPIRMRPRLNWRA